MEHTISDTQIQQARETLQVLKNEIQKKIVGQDDLIDSILIAFLANGHILLE